MNFYKKAVLLSILPAVMLVGCSKKTETTSETKTGEAGTNASVPVVAKVNGENITARQLASAMARIQPPIPAGQEAIAEQYALRKLVEQQLFAKAAKDKNLEQDEAVKRAIEEAKNQVLAQAHFEQVTRNVIKPSDAEIHDYFIKTPQLFSDRRIYNLVEITIRDADKVERVKQIVGEVKTLEELAARFHSEQIVYRTNLIVKAAEDLPLPMLDHLYKMKKGEVTLMTISAGSSLLQVQEYESKPVTEEIAKPAIAKFLLEQKRKAAYDEELKKLKASGKVEFMGKYAEMNKAAVDATAPVPAGAPSGPAGQPSLEQFKP